MIIHPIQKKVESDYITLSAKIDWTKRGEDFPENDWYKGPYELWYKFDRKYENKLSDSHNGFLVPLVCMAMFFNEDIHVRGTISEKLAYSLREYQRTLHFWKPKTFSIISITSDAYTKETNEKESKGAMCTYSGGVDSSYTLWTHLKQHEPNKNFQISHALHLHAFATGYEDEYTRETIKKSFSTLMDSLDINFVLAYSNVCSFQQFDKGYNNYLTHPSILAGVALFFENEISTFFFSADNTHDYQKYANINHLVTPYFSTEKTNVIVHAASTTRLEKIKAISQWPETYNRLIPCFKNLKGLQNCGTCRWCLTTMALMEMAGVLNKYSTFPHNIDRRAVRKLRYPGLLICCGRKWVTFAIQNKRWDIAIDFAWVVFMSYVVEWSNSLWNDLVHVYKSLNYFFNPLTVFYRHSALWKRKSPQYKEFVRNIKHTFRLS